MKARGFFYFFDYFMRVAFFFFFIDAFPLICSLQDVLIQPGSGLAAGCSQTGRFSEWRLPGTKVQFL